MRGVKQIDKGKDKQQINIQPHNNKEEGDVEVNLYSKFLRFLSNQKMENLRHHLKMFHGRNFPIYYKKQYNFSQQWQENSSNEQVKYKNSLEDAGILYFIFSILIMIMNVLTIWVLSFERYFETKGISSHTNIHLIQLIFHIVDISLRVYERRSRNQHNSFSFKLIFRGNIQNLTCMSYFGITSFYDSSKGAMYLIEIVIICLLYMRAAGVYRYLKVMEIGLNYENQIKIFNLCCNIFIQAHIFALILYSASRLNSDKNWVDSIGITGDTSLNKYIYSFYFASTTMLTIGYGDITPKCPQEIIITVLIQIVGVVSFGYLLNQMGHTLSKMRQQSQEVERDLQTISKISKYYNLEQKLQNRAKNFILCNQVKSEELKLQDQNRVLMKLNQQLREDINHENSLSVVKSCVFFICHWSKSMQFEIAKLLEKKLFAPNEKLISSNNLSRVYIIRRGHIDLYMNRYKSNQDHRKLLKTIKTKGQAEVAQNIYGYTTAFSNRPVRLQAVAKEFTSTYSVNRDEFMECVRQNPLDFQYFHQIKCRIDQSTFCQEWEAPSIKNIRQHYCPNKILIIKKTRNKLERIENSRKFYVRRRKTHSKIFQNLVNSKEIEQQSLSSIGQKTIQLTIKEKKKMGIQDSLVSIQSEQDSYVKSFQHAIQSIKARFTTKSAQENDNKKVIGHIFQRSHEFRNFFKFQNKHTILNLLQRSNCMERNLSFQKKSKKTLPSLKNTFPLEK